MMKSTLHAEAHKRRSKLRDRGQLFWRILLISRVVNKVYVIMG